MVTTRPPKTIVKPTALGPVANTDTKLLIYGLFQKGRVLAQDAVVSKNTNELKTGAPERFGFLASAPVRYSTRRSFSNGHREVDRSPWLADRRDNELANLGHDPRPSDLFPPCAVVPLPRYEPSVSSQKSFRPSALPFTARRRRRSSSVRRSFLPRSRALRTLFSSSK